ncbi:MAG: hypothetical protein WBX15_07855 [Thermoanaerobaculia bacterium]
MKAWAGRPGLHSRRMGQLRLVSMKFAGQERDFGTYNPDGVDYMHARYYDNRLSRFTTMDPLGGSPGAPQS